jgi:hypothetical protein
MTTNNGTTKTVVAETKPINGKQQTPKENPATPAADAKKDAALIPEIAAEVKTDVTVLPIQLRLKKIDELNKLIERRSLLADALDDVQSFVHTPTAPASIKFIDSTNKGFSVSNPMVIADMLKLAAERLESELEKVEALIKF